MKLDKLARIDKIIKSISMGRTYWFECSKCGYRAQVSGKSDRGLNFYVQTIACADCKSLYDTVTRLRVPDDSKGIRLSFGLNGFRASSQRNATPPSFQSALNRLPYEGVKKYKWLHFKARCPVSPIHRVQNWSENDKCPRCGLFLDKNALPYRIWE